MSVMGNRGENFPEDTEDIAAATWKMTATVIANTFSL